MVKQVNPRSRVVRDYRKLWKCIGPRDKHLGIILVRVPESMMPERGVMIAIICNHAPDCLPCRGRLGRRLDAYLREKGEK